MCVCHSDEVIREADANDTSGELGSAFPESLVGESAFKTANLEMLTVSANWLPQVSVVPECQNECRALKSPSTSESVPVSMGSRGGK